MRSYWWYIWNTNNICSTYKVLEGAADLGYDGFEAYKIATRYSYDPYTQILHYNLYSTLHQLIKANPLSWKFHHVKGHQYNSNTYNNIDERGRINIEADRLVKYWLWCQILT